MMDSSIKFSFLNMKKQVLDVHISTDEKKKIYDKIESDLKEKIVANRIQYRFFSKIRLPEMILTYKTQGKDNITVGKAEIDGVRSKIAEMDKDSEELRKFLHMVQEEKARL